MFRVGTSGWSYDHWEGVFYPQGLGAKNRLAFYAEHFDTVEINSSFYRLPSEATFDIWRESVSPGFVFSVKASRYLTHVRRLADPQASLDLLLDRARRLGDRLGPVLFQLPPRWRANPARLHGLVQVLPGDLRFAIEFRDPSWQCEEVAEVLRRRKVAFCIYDMVGLDCPLWVTAPFVYVRLHGTSGGYGGSYPAKDLDRWADWIRGWVAGGLDVYAYFNNDVGGHAVRNAGELVGKVMA